ncbi:MAG: hypothetical protein AABZ47_14715 [Planctomycetota bacterium]
MSIAQRFNAGSCQQPTSGSAVGTVEEGEGRSATRRHSVVPTGLKVQAAVPIPSDKSLGYFRMSLRDAIVAVLIVMGLAAAPVLAQTQYVLDNSSIDTGTRTVQADVPGTGGARKYELSGSIGQPDAGCLLGELTLGNGAQIAGGFMGAFACESYADLIPSCLVDLDDLICMLNGFAVNAACPQGDIAPCGGSGKIDVDDLIALLQAFAGYFLCPHACSP